MAEMQRVERRSINGGHQKSQSRDDAFAVLSSWFDDERAIPVEWKEEMDAM